MADYTKTAVAEIRDYLWQELQDNNILNKNEYIADGFIYPLNPIIPAQQVPEFNNLMSGKPYIFYDFQVDSYSDDFWMCSENLILYVVCKDYGKSLEIINFLIDLFRRMDLTAKDLNLAKSNTSKFKYHYFYTNSVESPQPMEEEGGNQISVIDISYTYSREIGPDGRFL